MRVASPGLLIIVPVLASRLRATASATFFFITVGSMGFAR
jgi:hypothetical protein